MLCYRDMTFCKFHDTCEKGEGCFRALTDEVKRDADEWWGDIPGGAPIATFVDKPVCYEEKGGWGMSDGS